MVLHFRPLVHFCYPIVFSALGVGYPLGWSL